MEKARNSSVWTEEGYELFANEGIDGLQVERLARILHLNKSGFYHYFGDLDGFCTELLNLHQKKSAVYLEDIKRVNSIDPEFLLVVIEHKMPTMFQMQLIRCKPDSEFHKVAMAIDQKEDVIIRRLWTDFIGIHNDPDLAMRYFHIVRDMFYARISFENFNYQFLQSMVGEAKVLMQQMIQQKTNSHPE
jgi:AcrR family transcriptional regulator